MRGYLFLTLILCFSFCKQKDKPVSWDTPKDNNIPINSNQPAVDEFASFVEGMKIYEDSSVASIVEKLKIINAKYGQNAETDIIKSLKRLNENAYNDAIETIKSGDDVYFTYSQIDIKARQERYIRLMRDFARQGNFTAFLALEKKYYSLFDGSKIADERVITTLKSIKKYNQYTDSLDRENLPLDEKAFLKATGLRNVCSNGVFEGEACYDLSVMFNAFKALIKKYPDSKFAGQADFLMFSQSFCDEGGADEGELSERVKQYKSYLKKYQNAGFEVDIQLAIFYTLLGLSEAENGKAIKQQGQLLLTKFPNHEQAEYIRERIKLL